MAFIRLSPPWETVTLLHKDNSLEVGSEVRLLVHMGPLRIKWIARHVAYIKGKKFTDVQVQGPFSRWKHKHLCLSDGESSSILRDEIKYRPPLGIGYRFVTPKIERMFHYRHTIMKNDLQTQITFLSPSRHIVVYSPDTYFCNMLKAFLNTSGHTITHIDNETDLNTEKMKDTIANMDHFICIPHEDFDCPTSNFENTNSQSQLDDVVKYLNRYSLKPFNSTYLTGLHHSTKKQTQSDNPSYHYSDDIISKHIGALKTTQTTIVRFGYILSLRHGLLKELFFRFNIGLGSYLNTDDNDFHWISIDDAIYNVYGILMNKTKYKKKCKTKYIFQKNKASQDTLNGFCRVLASTLNRPLWLPYISFLRFTLRGKYTNMISEPNQCVKPPHDIEPENVGYFKELPHTLNHLIGM